jgi:ferric-chelate reductase (NADPH)
MSKFKKTILNFVGDRILTPARVSGVEKISENFQMLHLESALFEKESFRPGEKIQINTGDWDVRTYTPIAVNPRVGRLSILAFLHGNGPGSRWASSAKAGDCVQVLGPRPSLSLRDAEAIVFFGDETSFAVASTFIKHFGEAAHSHFVFEVASISEAKIVGERIGLDKRSVFITRQLDDSHLEKASAHLQESLKANPMHPFLLTGNAKSILHLRNQLRTQGLLPKETKLKAYWAPGKMGLD